MVRKDQGDHEKRRQRSDKGPSAIKRSSDAMEDLSGRLFIGPTSAHQPGSHCAGRIDGLPGGSAYRRLTNLQAAGLIRRVTANDGSPGFELAEDLTEHHHHLLCINCGKVTDVTLPASFEQQVTEAIGQLASGEGLRLTATASTCSASATACQ